MQVRAQGTRALVVGAVPFRAVRADAVGQKRLQPLPGSRLARRPCLSHRAGPVDRGQQLQGVDGERLSSRLPGRRSRAELPGGGHGLSRLRAGQQRPPEWREHRVGTAFFRCHLRWLKEQRAVEALDGEAVVHERLLDRGVASDHRRLVPPIPDDVRRRKLPRELSERRQRRTAADDQGCAGLAESPSDGVERLVQPPTRRGPRLPRGLLLGGPDEDGHDCAACRRGGEGRMVIQPEVVAKPDDCDGGGWHGRRIIQPCDPPQPASRRSPGERPRHHRAKARQGRWN